ncbi:hypothetical protein [Borreliella burgdorferi]|uniref:Uncharacterized protein n=1 Tax=Borreliella burgdorferi 118a TaxID=476210 RepID=A0A7U8EY71_BORBG|nr:conserved hypothetical protein [Borreliella burgdorferi 118a]PRQ99163.1 hypothetical protein CV679_01785 [Borreliella burgdorferi]PRR33674.1 hypothetical protein CV693_01785 [Borreliella burgdorferi]PRR36438.1 hypothetical protein CV687_02560 [Borreliella burgdorferi]
MLNSHPKKKQSLYRAGLVVLQITESLLILALLYQAINKLIFINNYSIKFMLTFILYSPEFFMANLTIYYFIYEKFKILHSIIVITKLFQIILTLLLFILGFIFKIYVYQTSLAIILGITVVYLVFNVTILALIKAKIKNLE